MNTDIFIIVTLCVMLKQIEGNLLADLCKPEYASGYPTYYLNGLCYVFRNGTPWNSHSCGCKVGTGSCQTGRASVQFTNSNWNKGFDDGGSISDCAVHCAAKTELTDVPCRINYNGICQFDLAPCGPLASFPPARRNTWVNSNSTVECVTGVVERMCQSDGQWGSYNVSTCKRPLGSDCTGNPYTECVDGSVCKPNGRCACLSDNDYQYYNSTLARYDCRPCEQTTEPPVASEGWTPVTQQSYSGKGATAGKVGTFKKLQKPNEYFCQFECTRTYGCAALTFIQSTGTCLLHTDQAISCSEATERDPDAVFMMVI